MKKIIIVIPAYKAEETLKNVFERIPKDFIEKVYKFIIVNDGSPDRTKALVKKLMHEYKNIILINHRVNKGYGAAQKTGFNHALKEGADIVILLHADGQYAPELLPKMVLPLEAGQADIIMGSRILGGEALKGGMPLYKFLGNKILTFIENLILGLNLSEYHSGFRLYSCEALKKIPLKLCSDDFHFDTEIIIQLMLNKAKIIEMPIPTHYGKEKCHINIASYSYNILKTLMEYILYKHDIRDYEKFSACLDKKGLL